MSSKGNSYENIASSSSQNWDCIADLIWSKEIKSQNNDPTMKISELVSDLSSPLSFNIPSLDDLEWIICSLKKFRGDDPATPESDPQSILPLQPIKNVGVKTKRRCTKKGFFGCNSKYTSWHRFRKIVNSVHCQRNQKISNARSKPLFTKQKKQVLNMKTKVQAAICVNSDAIPAETELTKVEQNPGTQEPSVANDKVFKYGICNKDYKMKKQAGRDIK